MSIPERQLIVGFLVSVIYLLGYKDGVNRRQNKWMWAVIFALPWILGAIFSSYAGN